MEGLNFDKKTRDPRLKATIFVWILSIPLILACVPIVALTENGLLLPMAVLITVGISTVSIWLFGRQKNIDCDQEMQQLETRVANLETIADIIDFEKRILKNNLK
jgi:hypothetical protein